MLRVVHRVPGTQSLKLSDCVYTVASARSPAQPCCALCSRRLHGASARQARSRTAIASADQPAWAAALGAPALSA
eukprot:6445782-Prymnesium_polylepis.1